MSTGKASMAAAWCPSSTAWIANQAPVSTNTRPSITRNAAAARPATGRRRDVWRYPDARPDRPDRPTRAADRRREAFDGSARSRLPHGRGEPSTSATGAPAVQVAGLVPLSTGFGRASREAPFRLDVYGARCLHNTDGPVNRSTSSAPHLDMVASPRLPSLARIDRAENPMASPNDMELMP